MDEYRHNNIAYIRSTYSELLKYYYKMNIGDASGVTGVIITERLIKTIEKRYTELGGNPIFLKLKVETSNVEPSVINFTNGYFGN